MSETPQAEATKPMPRYVPKPVPAAGALRLMGPPAIGLTIVVPVYRGAATVALLVEALAALQPEGGMEVILVNDGSPDNSGEVCREIAAAPPATPTGTPLPVVYIEHARNYGEHNAVMTGLRHARGRFVITMDDDLQNPPEEVIKLYDHARLGNWDVVYTRYAVKKHAPWRNLGSQFANKVADWLLDKPRGLYLSSFRCMSALVVRSVTRYRGPYPYVDGLIMEVTQRITSPAPRAAATTPSPASSASGSTSPPPSPSPPCASPSSPASPWLRSAWPAPPTPSSRPCSARRTPPAGPPP
jgi:undecaprenyl-phosphate 4-deoxy-4-formamido-L-arabinose transferase